MKKRILALVIAVLLILSLSGCDTITLNVFELMSPPKATGEMAAISDLIDRQVGKGYTLKYPQNGSYRSAVTTVDFDGDNEKEAIAFYLPEGEAQTVHLLIMDMKDGSWTVIGDHTSKSSTVDRLMFSDLDGDGVSELIVGWGTYNTSVNDLYVYLMGPDNSTELISGFTYTNIISGDFTENGRDELLLISLYTQDKPASATLITLNNTKNSIYSVSSTDFDDDITSFAKLQTGDVFYSQFGAVIDGVLSSGSYTTQILYYNKYFASLERVSFKGDAPTSQYSRSYAVLSEDIDSDGIIEIPNAFKMNIDKTQTEIVPAAHVYWCEYSATERLEIDDISAASLIYGFYFFMPDSWEGNTTAYVNYSANEVVFCEWDESHGATETLIIFKMFTNNAWNDGVSAKGYTELAKNDSYVYSFMIPQSNSSLLITNDEITEAFRLIS